MEDLNSFLRNARIKQKLTQEKAAELLDVSVNTIQNWERGDYDPDNRNIKKLTKVYKISWEDICSKIFSEAEEDEDVNNIPEFMLTEEEVQKYRKLELSLEEQELLILLHIYNMEKDKLPYEYIERTGIFKVLDMLDNIDYVLSYINRIQLINIIRKHPNKKFCFKKQSKNFIGKYLENLMGEDYLKNMYEFLLLLAKEEEIFIGMGTTYDYEEFIDEQIKRSSDRYYYEKKYSFRESVNLPSDILDALKKKLDERGLYRIYSRESTDESYLLIKEKYERDLEFYNKNKEEHPEIKAPDKYVEKHSVYVAITENGRHFIEWYKGI